MIQFPQAFVSVMSATIASGFAGGVVGVAIGRIAPSFLAWLCTPGPKFLGKAFEPMEFGFGLGAVAGLLLGSMASTCLVIALAFRDARLSPVEGDHHKVEQMVDERFNPESVD